MTINSSAKILLPFIFGVILTIFSCNSEQTYSSLPKGASFLDEKNMDKSVLPGNDFYQYAGGTWIKNNPVPASESRWGSFNLLNEFNLDALKGLCEESMKNPGDKNTPSQMVGDFFASGMDSTTINSLGIKPIEGELQTIDNIHSAQDITNYLITTTKEGRNPLFSLYIGPDDKNVNVYITAIWQGGIGLPDRDYYFKTDSAGLLMLNQYKAHIAKMLSLANPQLNNANDIAQQILNFETKIASSHMDRVSMRDPYKLYNKFSLAQMEKFIMPNGWESYFTGIGVKTGDSIIINQPQFLSKMMDLIQSENINVWKNYLRWHCISFWSNNLSKEFDEENFNFYEKILNGKKEQKPRWKRILQIVDNGVGFELGKLYTKKYFTAAAKERMLTLVNNLQQTFEEHINNLAWMSDSTKVQAKEKLHSFVKKIGYPDEWKSYQGLNIERNAFVSNIRNAMKFEFEYMANKMGKAMDKNEWMMTPPTVNAYYNPAFNEIVFPAGILQFPFFSLEADDAVIYGAIGAVIGHEMTHGFDDQGAQYAADGNLKNWWSAKDKILFDAKAEAVKKQFNAYTILGDKHVNGALTLGENIADLGGVTIAYDAYKKTEQGKKNEMIDGFTADQRFFLSWAQVWRQSIRDEDAAQRLVTDPHSPGVFRCNGPLSNFTPFYKAFDVKEGQKMWKAEADRIVIW